MADQIKEKEVDAPSVGTVTTSTPAEADKTSNPVNNDAKGEQPPVRTQRPDVPIAQSLAAGAGAHEGRDLDREVDGVAVDENGHDRDGRYIGVPKGTAKK